MHLENWPSSKDAVADEAMLQRHQRGDRAVPADPHIRADHRIGADDAAGQPEHVDDEKAHALVEGRRAGPGGRDGFRRHLPLFYRRTIK